MLIEFEGVPLIRRVFDKVSSFGFDTYVLTDSDEIAEVIPQDNVKRTGEAMNGTHRISMVDWSEYDYVINIQGDMIDINGYVIEPLIHAIRYNIRFDYATLYTKGAEPNDVKVIHNDGDVHWFTRADMGYGDRHLGVYAYKSCMLGVYPTLKDAYPVEDLEQNRMLGFNFIAFETNYDGKEINTKADIDSWSLQP